jgi:uncharacterized membrane protein YkgB
VRRRKQPTPRLWVRSVLAFLCTCGGWPLVWVAHGTPRSIGVGLVVVGGMAMIANGIWISRGGGYR